MAFIYRSHPGIQPETCGKSSRRQGFILVASDMPQDNCAQEGIPLGLCGEDGKPCF